MIQRIKDKLGSNKYRILAVGSFAAAAYFFYRYFTNESEIHLSSFLKALEAGQLDQVIVKGSKVWFKSAESNWFSSELGSFPVG